MRLDKLYVTNFGPVESAELEFGAGLNVVHGPNDLGKSTLVAAIRLGLLLPSGSTHVERYAGWDGGPDPAVEITFTSAPQRIWRVCKKFGRSGSAVLYDSRDGVDFAEAARGRAVDGKLREILSWGIPEPGGQGGTKGLPESFLSTALLSPQEDVDAVLRRSLRGDGVASGKERIAQALQALAQDPRFLEVLSKTQERRDEAYTPKGAPKKGQGSPFKAAADRVNQSRSDVEKLQDIVDDSEGAEKHLNGLIEQKNHKQGLHAEAAGRAGDLERLARQTAHRSTAWAEVQHAQNEVERIQGIAADTKTHEGMTAHLADVMATAAKTLETAKAALKEAGDALKTAELEAGAQSSQEATTLLRQQLELQRADAERRAHDAKDKIAAAEAAQERIAATSTAETILADRVRDARIATEEETTAQGNLAAAEKAQQWCDVLQRALELRAAETRIADAENKVAEETRLRLDLAALSTEQDRLTGLRSKLTVPAVGALGPMRALASDLDKARAMSAVGLHARVTPKRPFDLRVRSDGQEIGYVAQSDAVDIEADSDVELAIGDVATVRIRGGRRDAQERLRTLEDRWKREVEPHLAAAGVTDLAGLDASCEEARDLDTRIKDTGSEAARLREDIVRLDEPAASLQQATDEATACLTALEDIEPQSLATDIEALGADPVAGLRAARARLANDTATARRLAGEAQMARTLADERAGQARKARDAAVKDRDQALTAFADGVEAALAAARAADAAAAQDLRGVAGGLADLETNITAEKTRIEALLSGARGAERTAAARVVEAEGRHGDAVKEHATEHGRLLESQKLLDAVDIGVARARLQDAIAAYEALPVPALDVTAEEVAAAQAARDGLQNELDDIEKDILLARGALGQVGGAVAGERLRDAREAFEQAERREKEVEADYEAWKLLLDTLKEADAAQASNLGQALAPAIAKGFKELTRQRYDGVQLTAELGTDGILVGGAVKPLDHFSVGTREQLSTLYRLAIADYLRSAIVLDDQLVQSDGHRMEWFRALLAEKAQRFQVVVFTCRPADYLDASAIAGNGNGSHTDHDGGLTRSIALQKALSRR